MDEGTRAREKLKVESLDFDCRYYSQMVLLRRKKAEELFTGSESKILFWTCKFEISVSQVEMSRLPGECMNLSRFYKLGHNHHINGT